MIHKITITMSSEELGLTDKTVDKLFQKEPPLQVLEKVDEEEDKLIRTDNDQSASRQ